MNLLYYYPKTISIPKLLFVNILLFLRYLQTIQKSFSNSSFYSKPLSTWNFPIHPQTYLKIHVFFEAIPFPKLSSINKLLYYLRTTYKAFSNSFLHSNLPSFRFIPKISQNSYSTLERFFYLKLLLSKNDYFTIRTTEKKNSNLSPSLWIFSKLPQKFPSIPISKFKH